MANNYFNFKRFSIKQELSGMKVGTDGVLLGAWADISDSKLLLDIGTGTGLLAIMAAQRSESEIIAIEPDKNSFNDAYYNINQSEWESRIKLINTNIQKFTLSYKSKFDHIISNPPYFINSLLPDNKSKSIAKHSITLSLSELLSSVSKLLNKSGKFSVIIPSDQEKLIIAESLSHRIYCNRKLYIKPTPFKDPKRLLMEFSFTNYYKPENTICIEKGVRHDYSKEYKDLTKDFYLKF